MCGNKSNVGVRNGWLAQHRCALFWEDIMRCQKCNETNNWMGPHPAYDGDNCVLLCKGRFQQQADECGCLCSFVYMDESQRKEVRNQRARNRRLLRHRPMKKRLLSLGPESVFQWLCSLFTVA